jgi:signal transduction histidine kinase
MDRILIEVQERLAHLIKRSSATIRITNSWPSVLGHAFWVEEIWVNYLSNAIKYGGNPPEIELGARIDSKGMARFWVCDNGPGISPEEHEHLFIPFAKPQRANSQGHGLGLSIAQRLTTKLGGEVGVESESDKGSLFWFTLPLA